HHTPTYTQGGQTRLKNLLQSAQDETESHQLKDSFDKARQLLDDTDFWRQTAEGLAILISDKKVDAYHLPYEIEERWAINDSLDIAPLLLTESLNQPYYVLALAQHNPVAFIGDSYDIERLEVDLPSSPEKALNI